MDIYDLLFSLQFLVIIGIILMKTYNAMSMGTFYDIKMGFILFTVFLIAWLTGMIIMFVYPEELLFRQIWTLESWFMLINVLFLFFEIFITIRDYSQAITQTRGRYNPLKVKM